MPRTPKEADNQPRKLFLEATRTRVHLGRVIVNSAPDSRLGESEASSAARNFVAQVPEPRGYTVCLAEEKTTFFVSGDT
ncbi:hypothetical protein B2J93_5325 [Marssonina coronariae]|uniref:Uncharacterized protein n=1 Tax=Diplocarpon coronariae TaxID=2795749 RepID=A0A218ZF37_9HELO|nr:hypothetical protein B2J93_5325 [Marssonina coronariae]